MKTKLKDRRYYFLFPLAVLLILIFLLDNQVTMLPPLGKVLSPFIGVCQNGNNSKLQTSEETYFRLGLTDSVRIFFDERKVPHIFARNAGDLYFAQGYVTAYLRLWQMDFLTYVSAGRLSEIIKSPKMLEYDRNQRRIGMLESAKESLKLIQQNPETFKIISAYTKGVNAYISQLKYKTFPVEFKLLDYQPESWSDLKTILVMKNMTNVLSGYEEDLSMTNMMLTLGETDFNKLFPDFNKHVSPVMNDTISKLNPSFSYLKKPDYISDAFLSAGSILSGNPAYNRKLGSNNWAVSGRKTESGYPILCSDPHLNFSLPAIWLEMQLVTPEMNVYGVSIPGMPAVIVGFNKDIAWALTNGQTDVKDWYKLRLSPDGKKYEFDGKWKELTYRIEEIKRKGQKSFYDTIYSSIHGPIVNDRSFENGKSGLMNCALKWELHQPSNDFLTFIRLNNAKNYDDFKKAIATYACPIQNFVFASKDNTIAINHQGHMAVKWPGQGKFILDGTKSNHLYSRYIPVDSLPHSFNPACNYVLSANQHPSNSNYGYYYNGYYEETRANQIRKLLEKENKFTIEKMEMLQLNNVNPIAVDALPELIKQMDKQKLTTEQNIQLTQLQAWNGCYNLDDENAEFFELWWKAIKDSTWDEIKRIPYFVKPPDDYILIDLIKNEPDNKYFDKKTTSTNENATDIIRQTFIIASHDYNKLKQEGSVRWGDCHKVNILHITNIPAFSQTDIPSAGYSEAINAVSPGFGPSWRMIVELGDKPKGYGIYPGGQSGNAGSDYYDNFIHDWNKGKYYTLQFYLSAMEARRNSAISSWILK